MDYNVKNHEFFAFYLGSIADKSAICMGIIMKERETHEVYKAGYFKFN